MADQTEWQQTFRQPGALQSSSPGSPGLGGAISDAVQAAKKYAKGINPAVTNRKAYTDGQVSAADPAPQRLGDQL